MLVAQNPIVRLRNLEDRIWRESSPNLSPLNGTKPSCKAIRCDAWVVGQSDLHGKEKVYGSIP